MVVNVMDVSIQYMLGDFRDLGLKEYLIRKMTGTYRAADVWAVSHVTFQLEEGDFLGVIGVNGSGKSTLLKAVSGILRPQKGTIRTRGRISALHGLGAGFDGGLTIRENIYLYGALLGYTEDYVKAKYDEILDFSELREYEGYRVRQLSSGMKARISFSVVSIMRPEILILDEVLAVGDGAFRQKSARKMKEIMRQGTATMFVSHSMGTIKELGTKALWLNKGEQMAFGDAREVCAEYEKYLKTLRK